MSIRGIQDSGGGILNNRFMSSTVGKYLTLGFLCLTSLSTVGLAISTGILDYQNKLLRNGYSEQSISLQQCVKAQQYIPSTSNCSSMYVIKGLYQITPQEEEEFVKYVKIGIPDLTEEEFNDYMSYIPDLLSASIEKYDGEITSSYNTLEVYPDGSLIIGAKDKDGYPTTELEWGLPYTRTSIDSTVSIVGNNGVVVDGIINTTHTGIRANSITANIYGVYIQNNVQSTNGGILVGGDVESINDTSIFIGGSVSANAYGIHVGGDVTSNDDISGSSGIQVIGNVQSKNDFAISVNSIYDSKKGIKVRQTLSVQQQAFVAFEQQEQEQVQRQYQQQQTQQEQAIATLSCTGTNSDITVGCIQINGKMSATAGCGIMVANDITGSGGNATIYVGGDVKLENTLTDANTSSAIYVGGSITSSKYGIYSGAITATSDSITANGDITSNSGGAIIVSGSVSSAFNGIQIAKNLTAGVNNTNNVDINAISIGKSQQYPNGNIESPGTSIYVLGNIKQTSPIDMTSNWKPEESNNAIYCGGHVSSYGNTISVYGSVSNNLEYNENYPFNQLETYPAAVWVKQGVKSNYTGVNVSSIDAYISAVSVNGDINMVNNVLGSDTIYVGGDINSQNLRAINVSGTIQCNTSDVCVQLNDVALIGVQIGINVSDVFASQDGNNYGNGVQVESITGFNTAGIQVEGSISGGSGGTGVNVGQINSVDIGVSVNSITADNTSVSVDRITSDGKGVSITDSITSSGGIAIEVLNDVYGNINIGTSDNQTAGKVEGNILLNSVSSVQTNDETVVIQGISSGNISNINVSGSVGSFSATSVGDIIVDNANTIDVNNNVDNGIIVQSNVYGGIQVDGIVSGNIDVASAYIGTTEPINGVTGQITVNGGVSNGISITGNSGPISIDGQVQGDGDIVVQLYSVTNTGNGQALHINTSITGDVFVETSIIDGSIIVQGENVDGNIQIGGSVTNGISITGSVTSGGISVENDVNGDIIIGGSVTSGGISVGNNVNGNINISGTITGEITTSCVEQITIMDGTCTTNFQNAPTSITGISSTYINTISLSKSYDTSIPVEDQQPGYIGSITTTGCDIGSINVQSDEYEVEETSYKLGGNVGSESVTNAINVAGDIIASETGIYVGGDISDVQCGVNITGSITASETGISVNSISVDSTTSDGYGVHVIDSIEVEVSGGYGGYGVSVNSITAESTTSSQQGIGIQVIDSISSTYNGIQASNIASSIVVDDITHIIVNYMVDTINVRRGVGGGGITVNGAVTGSVQIGGAVTGNVQIGDGIGGNIYVTGNVGTVNIDGSVGGSNTIRAISTGQIQCGRVNNNNGSACVQLESINTEGAGAGVNVSALQVGDIINENGNGVNITGSISASDTGVYVGGGISGAFGIQATSVTATSGIGININGQVQGGGSNNPVVQLYSVTNTGAGQALYINTSITGNIEIGGSVTNGISIVGNSGPITIDKINGDIIVNSIDGAIIAGEVDYIDISGSVSNGITVVGGSGPINVGNVNGNIVMQNGDVSGQIFIGGSVSNGISVTGSVTGEIQVQNDVNGNINIGGQVQRSGSDNAVVYLGGINANNGSGQALQIGDTALGEGVSVKGSIDINGELTVQNANIDAFQVNGITGNYSTGIYVTATNTDDVAISGFRSVGVNIEGAITAQVDEEESLLTAGVSISGGISTYDYAIYINDVNGIINSSSTGIYINVNEITSVGTAVQIDSPMITSSTQNVIEINGIIDYPTNSYGINVDSPTKINNGGSECPAPTP